MGDKKTILVVDDSAINLANIEQRLKEFFEIVPVNSGHRALKYLKSENAPDLILLDIRMAEMDGIETLKEIRALRVGADLPVIMLTGSSDRENIMECKKLGVADYVLKPFETQELVNRIQKALDKKQEGNKE